VWNPDANDLRLSVHQLYDLDTPLRLGAGPQFSAPCTKFEPLFGGLGSQESKMVEEERDYRDVYRSPFPRDSTMSISPGKRVSHEKFIIFKEKIGTA